MKSNTKNMKQKTCLVSSLILQHSEKFSCICLCSTVTVYNVASAQVRPGETAVVTMISGEEFEINQGAMFLVNTTPAAAGRRRRQLMQTSEEQALAPVLEAEAAASVAASQAGDC